MGEGRAVGDSVTTVDVSQVPQHPPWWPIGSDGATHLSAYTPVCDVFKCSLTSQHASGTHVMHQDASGQTSCWERVSGLFIDRFLF